MKKLLVCLLGVCLLNSCSNDEAIDSAPIMKDDINTRFKTTLILSNNTDDVTNLAYEIEEPVRYIVNGSYAFEPEDLVNYNPEFFGVFKNAAPYSSKTFNLCKNGYCLRGQLDEIQINFLRLFKFIDDGDGIYIYDNDGIYFTIQVEIEDTKGNLLASKFYETDFGGIEDERTTLSIDMKDVPRQTQYIVNIYATIFTL